MKIKISKKNIYYIASIITTAVIIVVGIVYFFRNPESAAAWFNDDWYYRQSVPITNAGSALTDYQIAITLDTATLITAGKMQSDCDDIRFTDAQGNVLPYWIEENNPGCNSATTKIWTKASSVPAGSSTIYLYYGNKSITSAQDGNDTFIFFDDFSGTLSKWTSDGNWSISSGRAMHSKTSGTWDYIYADVPPAVNSIIESRLGYLQNDGSTHHELGLFIRGTGTGDSANIQNIVRIEDANLYYNNYATTQTPAITTAYNTYYKETFVASAGNIVAKLDDVTKVTDTTAHTTESKIGYRAVQAEGYVDWIMARQYAATEPTVGSLGTEEKGTAPIAYWRFDEGNGTIAGNNIFPGVEATGGTIQDINGYRIHTFTGAGTFTVTKGGNVEVLVVAGGGGGGSSAASGGGGGGGGAGGLIYQATYAVTQDQAVPVTVGTGGAPGTTGANLPGVAGGNSSFGSITATGGGRGVQQQANGFAGGSGSGGGYNGYTTVTYGGSGVAGQGNAGGNTPQLSWAGGAGGGGAGGPGGVNKANHGGGDGGLGLTYSISGSAVTYARGGSGGSNNPAASVANTGEGGDAAYAQATAYAGADGVVIIRYPLGNNGTLTNMSATPSPTSGWQTEDKCVSGKCLAFDGTDDYVSNGNSTVINFSNNGTFTFSVWVKPNTLVSAWRRGIIVQESYLTSGYRFGFVNGGQPVFWTNQSGGTLSLSSSTNLVANQWNHIEVTYDNQQAYMYLNGVQTGSATGTYVSGTNTMQIGYQVNEKFSGLIDDVKVYNYARTTAQVLQDYNAGLSGISAASGASTTMGATSQKWMSDNLVGYWKMDESSWNGTPNEMVDSSGNGGHGVAVSGATTTTGKFGNAGSFDGVDDYVSISDANLTTDDFTAFTMNMWLYATSANLADPWIYWGLGYSYGAGCTGSKVDFSTYDTSTQQTCSNTVFPVNSWAMLTMTYDSVTGLKRIYINGVLDATESGVTGTMAAGSDLYFGDIYAANFTGKMDEVRMYSRALSAAEVSKLYEWAPGPLAYWKLDDNTGTTVNDSSGNGYASSTFTTPTWTVGKRGSALNFDGNDIIGFTYSGTLPALTIGVWIYPTDVSGWKAILQTSDTGDRAFYVRAGYLHFYNGAETCNSSLAVAANQWQYAVMTIDSSDAVKYYLNGKPAGGCAGGASARVATYFHLSGRLTSDTENFVGKIDDAKIYNYVRTSKQIMEDMGAGVAGPMAYWLFEEGQGSSVLDATGNGFAGTLTIGATGTQTTVTQARQNGILGKFGKSLNFDGTDDYVDLGNVTALNSFADYFSVSAWVKTSVNSGIQTIAGRDNDWRLLKNSTSYVFEHRNTSQNIVYSQSVNTSTDWVHVVATFSKDEGYAKLYLNGKLVDSDAQAGTTRSGDTHNYIGCNYAYHGDGYYNDYFFNGKIDDLKYYSYALTAADVLKDYNQGGSLRAGGNTEAGDTGNTPVAWWKMDDNTGTLAVDSSGNGYTGTLANSPTWTAGKNGSALKFNGTNQTVSTVSLQSALNGKAAMTMSAWVKPVNITTNRYYEIMRQQGTPDLLFAFQEYGTIMSFGLYTAVSYSELDVPITASNYTDGRWHHFEAVYDGATKKMYIDGILQTTTESKTGAIVASSSTNYIGSSQGVGEYFNGRIDDVKVYDYARTPAQVAYDYNRGKPVAYWAMDEGSGSTIRDFTGNGNTGTLTIGATGTQTTTTQAWTAGASGKYGTSLNFDANDDYFSVTSNSTINMTTDMSISLWLKRTSIAGAQTRTNILFKLATSTNPIRLGYCLDINNTTNKLEAWWGINTGYNTSTSNSAITDTNWHHIAITRSGTQVYMYIDGKLDQSNTYSESSWNISNQNLLISANTWDRNSVNGQMDDLRIYNYALTAEQVKQAMIQGGSARY